MAYASIASLMRTIELLLTLKSPIQSLICDHREEILTLNEKVSSLEVFLKNSERSNVSEEMTDLEAWIKEVANVVEYTIQLRLTEAVMANDEMQKETAREMFCDSLQQVAEDISRVQKESMKIQQKGKQASKKSLVQGSSSAKDVLNVKKNMVGRDDQRKRLLEDLTRGSSGELKVIPILGMGGIGKTTLAKEVYNDVSIRSHFDVRAWATVSSHHNIKEILLSLLRSRMGDTFYMEDEAELADMLQKSLKSRRYLIVMDDMWSSKAWDDVRQCFPSENNESRVLLTTRDTDVACYAGTENFSLQMSFMDPYESWNLFKSAAFANEELPSEYETIGKQIVDKCQGLPLTIVVVAGLLSKSERTIEDWENIAQDVMSFVTNDPDKQCLHVLGLSYNHLTSNLKACLLYFGAFPEDREILVKRLVRLWIAEGFLKLEKDFEGEAAKCLKDLVDRCLILVCEKKWDETEIKSCKVHDLIYELCLREAQSQNFIMNDIVFHYLDLDEDDGSDEIAQSHDIVLDLDDEPNPVPPKCRHLSRHKIGPCKRWTEHDDIHCGYYRALLTPELHHLIRGQRDDDVDDNNYFLKRTRSIISLSNYCPLPNFTLESEIIHFKLLRTLDLSPIEVESFPSQILCLIWLRYLALSGGLIDIPPEVCRLWNLQTCIVKGSSSRCIIFPEQIWELMQLRHLKLNAFYLPNPPSVSAEEESSYLVLSNVQTIYGLSARSCTKEVISGIRNVKKLGIYGDKDDCEDSRLFDNLVHLHQLEKLRFGLLTPWKFGDATIPSAKSFPAMLKKLELNGTCLRWEDMNIISELPNLEVLKVLSVIHDNEWYPVAGGFTQLKLLLIDSTSLNYWKATDDNFPALECLVLRSCYFLAEMPIEFAYINSLQLIELYNCMPKLEASAAQIQQEQEDIGNKPLDIRILKSSRSRC
uniref:Late blight resistance protein homolog R1A-3 n=1 Tax=Nicotiana tabacum TaxID=4097 RepID=A0A1S3Z817_TOBAC|nr:PREDICTED: putative late blight resistance protein homolog R1A-3 [Nicotiana tabacum]